MWSLIEQLNKRQQQLAKVKRYEGNPFGPLTALAIICLASAFFFNWVDKQDDIVGYTHHGVAIYRSDLEEENE